MNIYFGHSKDIDYQIYYETIKNNLDIIKYNFIFPHEKSHNSRNGRSFYKKDNIDLFIAEVSLPATGLGIELGFCHDEKIPIICFYKEGIKYSNSLRSVTDNFVEYRDLDDFIIKLKEVLES